VLVVDGHQRVDAVLVVHLGADDRRVEHTQHAQLGVGDHAVPLVTVEQVHRARGQRVGLVVGEVDQLALALDQPDRLVVVRVVELVVGAREDRRLVEREADPVAAEHDALGDPVAVLGTDLTVGAGDLRGGAHDHGVYSLEFWGAAQASTRAVASAMIDRPSFSSSSVRVSGGSSLATSSDGPAVSSSSPDSKATAQTSAAFSACSKARPWAMPRPRAVTPGCASAMLPSASAITAPLRRVSFSNLSSAQ